MKPIMKLQILSPEKLLFEGDVSLVSVPGSGGAFAMLPDHAPIISSLERGKISYVTDTGRRELRIEGGFMEQRNNQVTICVEL